MAKTLTASQILAALKKWNVNYREYPGWKTRGRPGSWSDVTGLIEHHTGGGSGSDSYLKFLFVTGRPAEGIPGPLCQFATDADGIVHVGAVGRANHGGKGSSATWEKVRAESYNGYSAEISPGVDNMDANARYYGNEIIYSGTKPMTAKAYNSSVRLAAAICDAYGNWSALSVIAHRESSSRKPDPYPRGVMVQFRKDVRALLAAGPDGGNDMPLDSTDKTAIRKIFQEELARPYTHDGPPKTTVSTRHGGRYSFLGHLQAHDNAKQLGQLVGQVAGLTEALAQLAAAPGQSVDMAAIATAAEAGANRAMAELTITVQVEAEDEEPV